MNFNRNLALKAANTTAIVCLLSAMPSMADSLNNVDLQRVKPPRKKFINKHFYTLSYLKNINDFQLINNDDINVATIEYGGKYAWGDSFIFFDRLVASANKLSPKKQKDYFEASVRLSIPYLFNQPSNSKPAKGKSALANYVNKEYVKDYFIAGTLEYSYLNVKNNMAQANTSKESSIISTNSLYGLGIAWQTSFFSYLNTNFYYAINEKQANDYQLTLSFAKSFNIAELTFKTHGFIDWSSSASDHKSSFHFSPQVLLDFGEIFNQPKLLFVGIEYSYWHNKYGLVNIDDEHTVSAMVKLSF